MTFLTSTEPKLGERKLIAGGVLSALSARVTAVSACTGPNPKVRSKAAPSPADDSIMPFTWAAVSAGFLDKSRPASPATTGVAIDVPDNAS